MSPSLFSITVEYTHRFNGLNIEYPIINSVITSTSQSFNLCFLDLRGMCY